MLFALVIRLVKQSPNLLQRVSAPRHDEGRPCSGNMPVSLQIDTGLHSEQALPVNTFLRLDQAWSRSRT